MIEWLKGVFSRIWELSDMATLFIAGILLLIILWLLMKLIIFIVETLFVSSFMLVICSVALVFVIGLSWFVVGVSFFLYEQWVSGNERAMGGFIIFGFLLCVASGYGGYKFLQQVKETEDTSVSKK